MFALMTIGVGGFTLAGAVMDWEWFMTNRRAWLFVTMFGRNGARLVYGVMGGAFVVAGVTMLIAGVF